MTLLSSLKSTFRGLVFNTVSGAVLFLIGDSIEQKFEINAGAIPEFDKDRLTRIGLIGMSEGPTHVIWYNLLDKYLPGKSVRIVGKKVLADQLIGCPVFSIQFFGGMSLLEGKSVRESWKEFTTKFPTVYLVDWMVWPPCQMINFFFLGPKYRVLYVNSVTVVWNIFLSYMKHYDQRKINQTTPSSTSSN